MLLDNFLSKFIQTTDYPTLDAMHYIMNKLGNPHNSLKFIHIAGTNGKGSICEMLNKILILSEYKVGKFISPHLFESNESISINNANITDKEFEKYIDIFQEISENYFTETGRKLTRFEILTSLAILYFYEHNCDIVVFEVGLGGMYDCTNIVNSLASVFGTIGLDHTAILGNTLEEIAHEKAGIIKENSNTIIFEQPALSIIEQVCNNKKSNLQIIKNSDIKNYHFDESYQYFNFEDYNNITINLKGKKQIENAAVCIKCCQVLEKNGFKISKEIIFDALKTIYHPARFEIIKNNPLIIFDGAHNANALTNFCETVQNLYKDKTKCFLVSIITTKNYKENLDILLNSFENCHFIFTNGGNEEKFFDSKILYDYSKTLNTNNFIEYDTLENALTKLNKESNFIVRKLLYV